MGDMLQCKWHGDFLHSRFDLVESKNVVRMYTFHGISDTAMQVLPDAI